MFFEEMMALDVGSLAYEKTHLGKRQPALRAAWRRDRGSHHFLEKDAEPSRKRASGDRWGARICGEAAVAW
ncbi:hypothetical protein [Arabiibacter massiliensis]|uniref:hypothetical protein n=1 Tax=Arabiibacter massiliensis TaxID=1870985 RepID=UPI00117B5497|nr:hypothetical protein [Arabiibacter massiliensis]